MIGFFFTVTLFPRLMVIANRFLINWETCHENNCKGGGGGCSLERMGIATAYPGV